MSENVTQARIDEITAAVAKIAPDVKALSDAANTQFANLKVEIDGIKTAFDKNDPIVKAKIDTIAASVETLEASIREGKAVSARVDALEAVNNRPGTKGGWADTDEAKAAKDAFEWHKAKLVSNGKLHVTTKVEPDAAAYAVYRDAFPAYMRARSEGALPINFQAAMQTGSDPDGGYLVPTTTSNRIIKKVFETSDLRSLATVETIAGKEWEVPRDEGEFGNGGWVGENTAPSETTTSQLGLSKIFAHEMFAEPRVTQNMIEDAGIDIEAWVANKVGEKFARVEATAFFTGDGTNKPRGILTYGSGTTNGTIEQVVSGGATSVTADAFYNLVFALKDFYTKNARFLMKRTTVRDVMKLKDGQSNYLWQMGDVRGGQPSSLLGFAVDRCEDMPTIAASSLSVAFGDFKAAYTIVDRLGITLLRDNLTAKPYVKFYNRRRVGGDVVNFEAVKLMVTST
jgi:HK97 family phage major capsid protein